MRSHDNRSLSRPKAIVSPGNAIYALSDILRQRPASFMAAPFRRLGS